MTAPGNPSSRSAQEMLHRAADLVRQGQWQDAARLCERLINEAPEFALGWHLRGLITDQQGGDGLDDALKAATLAPHDSRLQMQLAIRLMQRGRLVDAESKLRALMHDPMLGADAVTTLTALLARQGQLAEASTALGSVVSNSKLIAAAWYNLSIAMQSAQLQAEAESCLNNAVTIDPSLAVAHSNLGALLLRQDRLAEAGSAVAAALSADPKLVPALKNAALLETRLGNPGVAATYLSTAASLEPSDVDLAFDLAVALDHSGDWQRAAGYYEAVLVMSPNHYGARCNLAVIQAEREGASTAHKLFLPLVQDAPNEPGAYLNLARWAERAGDIEAASDWYRQLLVRHPQHARAHNNLAYALLSLGNYREGWQEYAWRLPSRELAPAEESFAPVPDVLGAIARLRDAPALELIAEQGLGDTLFFLRFAVAIMRPGRQLHLRCDPRLVPMLSRTGVFDSCSAIGGEALRGSLAVRVGDLPLLAEHAGGPFPEPLRLPVLEDVREPLICALGDGKSRPLVGITWRAGTSGHQNAWSKAVSLTGLIDCFRGTGCTLVVLQRGPTVQEIDDLRTAFGGSVLDWSHLHQDLDGALAALSLLDEYVCVSNTLTHFRAGVGRSARVLAGRPPEWRWRRKGEGSPWFPGYSLYEETEDGWAAPFEQLRADMAVVR